MTLDKDSAPRGPFPSILQNFIEPYKLGSYDTAFEGKAEPSHSSLHFVDPARCTLVRKIWNSGLLGGPSCSIFYPPTILHTFCC